MRTFSQLPHTSRLGRVPLGALVAVALVLMVNRSFAATYYVATNGSDSAPGTQAAPWRTIAYAAKKMVAGDTTFAREGVYQETKVLFSKSGTPNARISLLNYPGEKPTISFSAFDGQGLLKPNTLQWVVFSGGGGGLTPVGWITLEGFEIKGGVTGIRLYNAHDIIIRGNYIHDNGHGILGPGKQILIDQNRIHHNGQFAACARAGGDGYACTGDHGIYATGTRFTITNNIISSNIANGIQVAGYPWCSNGQCYGGGARTKADPTYADADGWIIANNTIFDNGARGVMLWLDGTRNSLILNNIFVNNGTLPNRPVQGVGFLNSGRGHVINNNLFYSSQNDVAIRDNHINVTGKFTETNNLLQAYPRFVNQSALNFALLSDSPARKKGLRIPQVATDFLGRPRPQQGPYDIGAYEFAGQLRERRPVAPNALRVR